VLGRAVRRAHAGVDFPARSGSRTAVPEGLAFEVDHFEWIDDRLEVSGRWYGLRGHRFVRPALTVEVDDDGDDRRRMLADLEHKPWAADDGTDWIAAFPWDGEPVKLARAELAVAPTLAIDLPLPPLPGRRRPAPRTKPTHRPTPRPPRKREVRDVATAERALTRERDQAITGRAALTRELDSLAAERDAAAAERDAAVAERDTVARERDAAVRARAAAVAERDDARRSLAAAIAERDRSEDARAALLRERDAARAPRQRDLEALEEPGDRRLPPAAPRPLPRQSTLALWGQRFIAVVALGVLAFVVYTLLEGVV
jgi:hypothetical protein